MNIEPMYDWIVIKEKPKSTLTKQGIILTDGSSVQDVTLFEVTAVGPGLLNNDGTMLPLQVKVGDVVIAGQNVMVVNIGQVRHIFCKESNIVAIVDRKSAF